MKHTPFKRWNAALLAAIVLCGILLGCVPVLLYISAAAADATGELTVAFGESYAKVGTALTADVQGGSSDPITYQWSVDGKPVGSGSSYTPTESDLMKWISVTVTRGGETATAEMFFSLLPVVYINTENGAAIVSKEDYIDAEMTIQGNETYNPDTTTLYSGAIEIRGRGNSTWAQPKKPYRIKLDKKKDLLGMGESKHWVLLANYMDESLQRNTLAYNLSGAMGMEQMTTVFVDVILNGQFVGNYQLCENIRTATGRVDIFDWETFTEDCAGIIADANDLSKSDAGDLEDYMVENMGWITSGIVNCNGVTYYLSDYPEIEVPPITGGYILELDEYYDEISKFKTDSNQPIMFKNPEFVGTNPEMMNYVQTYVQAFEDAVASDSYTVTYGGETLHYSQLYDMDALVDYWLVSEIFFNEEINKKSTYMYKEIDGLMKMGPIWDMDWSSGAAQGSTYHTNQWATVYFSANAQANQWYKYLIQDPYFMMKAQERYWEIRDNQVAAMMAELESNYQLLKISADANHSYWGHSSSFDSYTKNLRNWFTNHLSWMDQQMATQDSLSASLGYKGSESLVLSLTDADGKALAADTAKNAPADGVAADGEALELVIKSRDGLTGNAVVYVNGFRVDTVYLGANTTATVEIPAEALTASAGEKDIIEVKIDSGYGYVADSAFITVLEN